MGSIQEDLFGLLRPQEGVHRSPPGVKASSDGSFRVRLEGVGEVLFQRSWKARRYRLTLRRDGLPLATIPLRGTESEALRFVEQHRDWLERAQERQRSRPQLAEVWSLGTRVYWRGVEEEIRKASDGFEGLDRGRPSRPSVCLASDVFRVPSLEGDLRPTLQSAFVLRARIELPARAWELAAQTDLDMKQVTVRNQRSRWGSCSNRGVVSLNWRLIQTPESVRDYIIYHELAHLLEMNHSDRFWARVEKLCPTWREAEAWLKNKGSLLGL